MTHLSHNFLTPEKRRKGSAGAALAWLALSIALFFVGVIACVVSVGVSAYSHALAGKNHVSAAETAVHSLEYSAAADDFSAASKEFAAAQGRVRLLGSLIGFIPPIGDRIDPADKIMGAAITISGAAEDVVNLFSDITKVAAVSGGSGFDVNSFTPEKRRETLKQLYDSSAKFDETTAKVKDALAILDQVSSDPNAAPYKSTLDELKSRAGAFGNGLESLSFAARILPRALGYPQARRYLVVLQNNTELRPTGGFLGVVGVVGIGDAEINDIRMDDVYAFDAPSIGTNRPPAPAPLTTYIGVQKWYLRDANWSPDFAVSAQTMESFYRQEATARYGKPEPPLDGVIAVDPDFAAGMLSIVGDVSADGTTYTPQNLVDQLEFQVEKGFQSQGVPRDQRKDVVGKILQEVVRRIVALTPDKALAAIDVMRENLLEGHVLLYAHDPFLANVIASNDWGGQLHPVNGDYVSVIDANLASLKSDPFVDRKISYSIVSENGGHVGRVAITYSHHGKFDWRTTRYRTYTRLYVPHGSKFLSVDGAMLNDKIKDPGRHPGHVDVTDELGRTSFGTFISIEPGESKTLTYTFALAPSVEQMFSGHRYHLYVEKQPGTRAIGLTLNLDLGKKLTTATPAEDPSQFGDDFYRVESNLRTDRQFDVNY